MREIDPIQNRDLRRKWKCEWSSVLRCAQIILVRLNYYSPVRTANNRWEGPTRSWPTRNCWWREHSILCFETESHWVAQEDHEFSILLPHSFQVVGIIGLSHQAWPHNFYLFSIATKQRIESSAFSILQEHERVVEQFCRSDIIAIISSA